MLRAGATLLALTAAGAVSLDAGRARKAAPDDLADQSPYDITDYLNPGNVDPVKISKSATLVEPLQSQLFWDQVVDDTNPVDPETPSADAAGGTVVTFYHKTGAVFSTGLTRLLAPRLATYETEAVKQYSHGRTVSDFWQRQVHVKGGDWALINNPSPLMALPDSVRTVHFYRNPTATILSGYRYHMGNMSAESWESTPNMCKQCDEWASTAIFSFCNYDCGYYSLLNSVGEETGVILEAVSARRTLNDMVYNLKRWTNNRNVLHLTVEHLAADFNGTMACMLRFLGRSPEEQLPLVQELDIHGDTRNRHVTRSKYDNWELKQFLKRQELWSDQLRQIKNHEAKLWDRQSRVYGCPKPA